MLTFSLNTKSIENGGTSDLEVVTSITSSLYSRCKNGKVGLTLSGRYVVLPIEEAISEKVFQELSSRGSLTKGSVVLGSTNKFSARVKVSKLEEETKNRIIELDTSIQYISNSHCYKSDIPTDTLYAMEELKNDIIEKAKEYNNKVLYANRVILDGVETVNRKRTHNFFRRINSAEFEYIKLELRNFFNYIALEDSDLQLLLEEYKDGDSLIHTIFEELGVCSTSIYKARLGELGVDKDLEYRLQLKHKQYLDTNFDMSYGNSELID